MAEIRLSISAKHNTVEALAEVDAMSERVTGAVRRATTETVRFVVRHVRETMLERAGGIYWDINPVTTPTPDGATGRVVTPPSKPHRIEPTKRHGLLVFEVNGQPVFVKGGVNHPGSNPLDWITSLEARSDEVEDIYEGELGEVFGVRTSALPVGGL